MQLTPDRIAELRAEAVLDIDMYGDHCAKAVHTPELLTLLDMAERCQAAEAALAVLGQAQPEEAE